MTRIGILETGAPPPALRQHFGSYDSMFRRLLGPGYEFATFDVPGGSVPDGPPACDAYLVTGSAAGVHDGHRWIDELEDFIRNVSGRAPLIGVCFGHQLMAEAFGGRVTRSPKGWGIGLQSYRVEMRAPWMDDAPAVSVPVSHQDQIVVPPADAQVLAGNEFTPYAVLAYPQRRAISMQCHPEFTPEYAAALIRLRREVSFGAALADDALDSLRQPDDRQRVAGWLREFLRATG